MVDSSWLVESPKICWSIWLSLPWGKPLPNISLEPTTKAWAMRARNLDYPRLQNRNHGYDESMNLLSSQHVLQSVDLFPSRSMIKCHKHRKNVVSCSITRTVSRSFACSDLTINRRKLPSKVSMFQSRILQGKAVWQPHRLHYLTRCFSWFSYFPGLYVTHVGSPEVHGSNKVKHNAWPTASSLEQGKALAVLYFKKSWHAPSQPLWVCEELVPIILRRLELGATLFSVDTLKELISMS